MKLLKNESGGAKLFITLLVLIIIIGVTGTVIFKYYGYIFSKDIVGEVLKVERVTQVSAILGSSAKIQDKAVFSFSVAIKDRKTREIYTASTEDRQWAVVSPGFCVTAKFYPYPPWNLEKNGTFHNARLIRMKECDNESESKPKKSEVKKKKPSLLLGGDASKLNAAESKSAPLVNKIEQVKTMPALEKKAITKGNSINETGPVVPDEEASSVK